MNDLLINKKHILFDLGGVLLNIDYHRTSRAFVDLGITNFDELYSQAKQSDVFDKFETGELSDSDFRDFIRQSANLNLEDHHIDKAWNAMLLDFPLERMVLLEKLKDDFTLILISNTNRIHVRAFTEIINNHFGMKRFETVFDKLYYSSSIGRRKPDTSTFEWILSENSLNPKDCLFIDDSVQHIHGAKGANIHCFHLSEDYDIVELLRN